MSDSLVDLLAARSGIVCGVGAGGKKTTLYRLAREHPGRVGITSTVLIPPFPRGMADREVIVDEPGLLDALRAEAQARVIAFARPSDKRGRLGGLPSDLVGPAHRAGGFDLTVVKADGARSRWIKAPAEDEPAVPPDASTVLPIVSARALGTALSDAVAHRVERIERVTGARPGEPLTAEHVARLLAHPDGGLKGVGGAVVIPVINMVDDADLESAAITAARSALALTRRFDRVVLAAMRRRDPIVRVIERGP